MDDKKPNLNPNSNNKHQNHTPHSPKIIVYVPRQTFVYTDKKIQIKMYKITMENYLMFLIKTIII